MSLPQYKTILADFPWNERGGGKIQRGANRHYNLMKLIELAALGELLQPYFADDAYFFGWITNNYLCKKENGLRWQDVIEAWGFRPVTVRSWAKDRPAYPAQYFTGQTEHMIFAVRGKPGFPLDAEGKRKQISTLIGEGMLARPTYPGTKKPIHSGKPSQAIQEIDWWGDGPFIELFARNRFVSPLGNVWHCWGNDPSIESDILVGGRCLHCGERITLTNPGIPLEPSGLHEWQCVHCHYNEWGSIPDNLPPNCTYIIGECSTCGHGVGSENPGLLIDDDKWQCGICYDEFTKQAERDAFQANRKQQRTQ